MNTWSKEINLDDYAECKEFRIHYYTRRMNGGYNSHLFLVNWDSEEQLLKGWNQIDSFVAVNIQSQTELLIERSNFYIIHFVKKTVMKEIKREIEYNPFCAKKYVYDNFQEDLYVERNYVEEKIFHLAVSEVTEYENKKMRVKKIKLKNFRGYKGCVEFNLVDQDKKPASFVVIYAPNGVGKTSLFDGVEYALKGEVSYLKNTEKISKFKGPIYHNREKAYEEAYASIFLDNGEEIHRKVHTLKENGTDTDVVAASGKKAKDIVGLKKDNNKWDNILLPHAKIDSFISASKPEERYIEWFNSTPELNEERKYFERIGKDISVIDKSLIEIKKEIARLENERKKLEKSESNFKNIQKLISAFNKRSETILPNITSLSTETEYDELLNEVKKIIRDYNRQLNILKDHLILYNELNTMWNAERRSEKLQIEKENKIVELDKIQKNLEKELSLYFSKSTMNEIYQKIDPHDVMKRLEYHLSFNDAQKGELFITLSESESDSDSDYRPEIYFSTAQLNTVAFSSFFSRALDRKNNLPIQTIFIDDPIGHFDDMNILGFADLMRSLIDNSNWQIVISTHDEKIFRILQRKLSGEYYSSCFLKLPSGKGIKWIE